MVQPEETRAPTPVDDPHGEESSPGSKREMKSEEAGDRGREKKKPSCQVSLTFCQTSRATRVPTLCLDSLPIPILVPILILM